MDLSDLGWDDHWSAALGEVTPGLSAARVAVEHRGAVQVVDGAGTFWAEPTGKMFFAAGDRRSLPVVGDWVAVADADAARAARSRAALRAILPRRSCIVRRAAGNRDEPQPIAANIDVALVMTAADQDLNPRRLERYLETVRDGGATAIILLNKIDLGDDATAAAAVDRIRAVAGATQVVAMSAARGDGVELARALIGRGRTAVVIGSSGVGKSTLVNALAQAAVDTGPVRADDGKGRHTTTRRELFVLPDGGVLIDTPGMRELQLWAGSDDDAPAFADVRAAAVRCRFADCHHVQEPGCAVVAAIAAGRLTAERVAAYHKLAAELTARGRSRGRSGRPRR